MEIYGEMKEGYVKQMKIRLGIENDGGDRVHEERFFYV